MLVQKILISLTIVTYLIPVSNSMDGLKNIAINNNIQQINNLEQNNSVQISNETSSNLKLSNDFSNTKSLKLNEVLGNTNSLKLSGVFNDYNKIKYNKQYKNTNNINTITSNQSINISNLDAESTLNKSIINNNVVNTSHELKIYNNDPAINNTDNQTNTNTSQLADTIFLNNQAQDEDININKTEEQINNNKEDAANAKPKKKKNNKKKNKNKIPKFMHDEESIAACNELQQRITKHILSNKFKYFGQLNKAIMQSGPNEKIYEQFKITPDILQIYKEYYNKILDNIKCLLPSKLIDLMCDLQFLSAMQNTGKILVEIYNIIEDTDSYDPNDDDDIDETIKYVVDNEAKEIESKKDLSGKNILRIIGNLAAAISDVCLYIQPSLFQFAFSIGKDNENFTLAYNQLGYIGELFGIQELMKKSK